MEDKQRVALEEEVKLLKNQIKAVLLDIKDNMANGEWQAPSGPSPRHENPDGKKPGRDNHPEEDEELLGASMDVFDDDGRDGEPPRSARSQADPEDSTASTVKKLSDFREANRVKQAENPAGRTKPDNPPAGNNHPRPAAAAGDDGEPAVPADEKDGGLDLLTIVMLGQWLDRALSTLGREQTENLVNIYETTGSISPRVKQAMLLMIELKESARKAGSDSQIITSMPLLMDLDGLLHRRNRTLESAVINILLEKRGASGNKPDAANLMAHPEQPGNGKADPAEISGVKLG